MNELEGAPKENRGPLALAQVGSGPGRWWGLAMVGFLLVLWGCGRSSPPPLPEASTTDWHLVEVPASAQALAAELTWVGDRLGLTWLEPLDIDGESGHRLQLSLWGRDTWQAPQTVVSGTDFFANWADRPQLVVSPDRRATVAWLEKLGDDTYAYGLQLASTAALGEGPWQRRGLLHDDASASEHGFVSWLAAAEGVHGFWLDGRRMPVGGDMQLRTVFLPADSWLQDPDPAVPLPPSTLLDDRVCECCATDSDMTLNGPLVVYRDRGPEEIRDIAVVRWLDGEWTAPRVIHHDGWKIQGCPVNGPAVVARGRHVVVAWFTVIGGQGHVRLAFSDDVGATFGAPVDLDTDKPLGRLGLAFGASDTEPPVVWVSWMASSEDGAEIRLQKVGFDGEKGPPQVIAGVSGQRSSGVPRLATDGSRRVVVWRQDGDEPGLRSAWAEGH